MSQIKKILLRFGALLVDIVLFVLIAGGFALLISEMIDRSGFDLGEYYRDSGIEPFTGSLVEYFPLLLSILAALWVCNTIFKRTFNDAGFAIANSLRLFSWGAFLALILLSLGFFLLFFFNGLEIEGFDFDPFLVTGFIIFFLIQSSVEELVGRSYLIPAISSRSNQWVGLIGSSLIFALVHGSNPGISVLSIINIFLAGMLLGILFLKYRSIWCAIGFHAAWNFFQGSFFGFEVSGHAVYSVIDTRETGMDFITGGAFGFEGSALCTLFLSLVFYYEYKSYPELSLAINKQELHKYS